MQEKLQHGTDLFRNCGTWGLPVRNTTWNPPFRITMWGPPLEIMTLGPTFRNIVCCSFTRKSLELGILKFINARGWSGICRCFTFDAFENFEILEFFESTKGTVRNREFSIWISKFLENWNSCKKLQWGNRFSVIQFKWQVTVGLASSWSEWHCTTKIEI